MLPLSSQRAVDAVVGAILAGCANLEGCLLSNNSETCLYSKTQATFDNGATQHNTNTLGATVKGANVKPPLPS